VSLGDRQSERREHEQEDEHVVERERLLDQIAGQISLGVRALAEEQQDGAERERDRHPQRAGDARRAQAHLAAAAADDEQVDGEQHDERADQGNPGHGQREPPR
jgi:hypothetical protein